MLGRIRTETKVAAMAGAIGLIGRPASAAGAGRTEIPAGRPPQTGRMIAASAQTGGST
jgi:hypothetical protein